MYIFPTCTKKKKSILLKDKLTKIKELLKITLINYSRKIARRWEAIMKDSLAWFGLVCFYGISNIVGYLMPNPLYTYI